MFRFIAFCSRFELKMQIKDAGGGRALKQPYPRKMLSHTFQTLRKKREKKEKENSPGENMDEQNISLRR